MDCYDKIINFYYRNDRTAKCEKYLVDFINKDSKDLTELQFTNCLILILSILKERCVDCFLMEGKPIKKLLSNEKQIMLDLLEKEFFN